MGKFIEESPAIPSIDAHPENMKRFNDRGEEILDPTPMAPPLGYKRQPSLYEQIQAAVRQSKLDEMYSLEETEEEADDFEVGDDFEPMSEHENEHMPTLANLKKEAARLNDEIKKAQKEAALKKAQETLAEKGGAKAPPPPTTNSDAPAD